MEKYVEYAVGTPANRKFIVKALELHKVVEHNPDKVVFNTIFQFDERVLDCVKGNKLIRQYPYTLYITTVPIDIDKGQSTDAEVLERARKVVKTIESIGIDETAYQVFYSGTGYHIELSARLFKFKPSNDLPRIVKETLAKIFGELIDLQIYHRQGLIRTTYSVNTKSGEKRYKIPLHHHDFKHDPAEEIIRQSRECIRKDIIDLVANIDLSAFVDDSLPVTVISDISQSVTNSDNQHIPLDRIASCVHTLMSRGPVMGSRHETILRIASHFKKNGIPCHLAIPAIQEWYRLGNAMPPLDDPKTDEEAIEYYVKYTYRKPYKYGCNDRLLKKFCRSKCIFYKNRHDYSEIRILDVNELHKTLTDRTNIDFNTRVLRLSEIFGFKGLDIDVYPGELMVIAGITGTNKTALAQCISLGYGMAVDKLLDVPRAPTLVLSLELPGWQYHRRNLQIVANIDKKEAFTLSKKGIPQEYKKYMEHISIVETTMDVTKIESIIQDIHPSIVIIDYLDLVKKHRNSESFSLTDNMTALRNMTSRLDVIVILITQVNRDAALHGTVGLHSGKGSGAIENSASKYIGISGDPKNKFRQIRLEKNTDGQLFGPITVEWNPSNRLKRIVQEV